MKNLGAFEWSFRIFSGILNHQWLIKSHWIHNSDSTDYSVHFSKEKNIWLIIIWGMISECRRSSCSSYTYRIKSALVGLDNCMAPDSFTSYLTQYWSSLVTNYIHLYVMIFHKVAEGWLFKDLLWLMRCPHQHWPGMGTCMMTVINMLGCPDLWVNWINLRRNQCSNG